MTTGGPPTQQLSLECQACGATLWVSPEQRTAQCLYCASPSVIERPTNAMRVEPSFALGFMVGQAQAERLARHWQRQLGFFREPKVRRASVAAIRGAYLPAFLYSAVAHSKFWADIGEVYYTGSGDNRRRRLEWRPLAGARSAYVRDVLVTASRGLHNDELQHVEPYDLRALHRYSHALISGWPCEEPSMSAQECYTWARHEAVQEVARAVSYFLPGDQHRDLKQETRLEWENLDLALVPVWVLVLSYDPQKRPIRLIINGQTGKAFGIAPRSWIRILSLALGVPLLLLLALLALVLLVGLLQ